jgi:CheY-like chemotaxis protein
MVHGKGPVLLVEDDRDVREALRDALEDEGYLITEAHDGQMALDYLRSHRAPPLILLDWNMAPMNGAKFMDEVSKDPGLSKVPVVLLTADARAQENAKKHAFAGYLKKPVNLETLLETLRRYCG